MKPTIVIFMVFLFLSSCNQQGSTKLHEPGFQDTTVNYFSDTLTQDTFKIKLQGEEPQNQVIKFTITNSKGLVLYKLDIQARDLFNNYKATVDLKKKKAKAEFINTELNRFFDDENFLEPAITENETADSNVPDKAYYEELKSSGLNGFIYRLGPEQKIYIGWSRITNKVKIYYSCCK